MKRLSYRINDDRSQIRIAAGLYPQLQIKLAVTLDDDIGPCPPLGDDATWHVVRCADGQTVWRCIRLKT